MENSSLLPPVGVWAVLNPSVADHPLRPATDRRLGEPLPHQLANRAQAHPLAPLTRVRSFALLQEAEPMRSCRRFLGGIPHQRVGHPRATHPSATASLRKARPFDLHVLGTPPAFILSQDQTRDLVSLFSVPLPEVRATESLRNPTHTLCALGRAN